MSDINQTLAERGSRYGDFEFHAKLVEALLQVMMTHTNEHGVNGWDKCEPYMRQTLRMDCDKIARALNGDPFYVDNWHDKAGYNKLTENILERKNVQSINGSDETRPVHGEQIGANSPIGS